MELKVLVQALFTICTNTPKVYFSWEMIIMCHNVTSDDAVELRFEDETVVVYKDVTYDLFGREICSHRTLDGRNVLQFYQQHCSEISPLGWLKLFHKHSVEVVPCKIKNGKVFYD